MIISAELLDELIAHSREDPGNEVCGVIAVEAERPARALRVFRARNLHTSPLKFEIEPKELLKLSNACEELGRLGAIYHSHVRSAPYPSQTDVNFAANWPGVEWIIVGLADGQAPHVRSYLIEAGEITETAIVESAT
ncbi:MAG: M67 family metallopeptidase [Actinomycetota bacterium]|nr:M67 family metallopeptidase [Actinomycetota bacterium]